MRKLLIAVFLMFLTVTPHLAQQSLVELNVAAGFDGRFRENQWMPLLINVTNNGDPINGRLVVRPERADALTNTFSTPVTLASGARQSVFLYITMRAFGNTLRVELFNNQGQLVTEREVGVRAISSKDQLHVVVTTATNSAVNFDGVSPSGDQAFQVNWFASSIPDKSPALKAVNTLVFSDVDSGTLTPAQRRAIHEWVTAGGHLIVTGGPNWQPTAAGLTELLPLTPTTSVPVAGATSLARLGGDYDTEFPDEIIASIGDLSADAQVLATSDDGTPLLVRRTLGSGTIDYLTVDPSVEPLRSWSSLRNLWFTLTTSVAPRPSWTYGLTQMTSAGTAMEILPGFSALPEVMSMLAFLAAYILLIGPINYLVLNWLNRRELAWITIPALIVIFSVLAWATGFNLRGNEVILSRLAVVQSWTDSEQAQAEQLIGLLAPRRANYDLVMNDGRLMRPLLRADNTGSIFSVGASSIEIEQTDTFSAQGFPVDASFVAGFVTTGTLARPDIGGRVTINYSNGGNTMTVRGSIRNNTDLTLNDPVILARGVALQLGEPLAPGEQRLLPDAGLILSGEQLAAPAPAQYIPGSSENRTRNYRSQASFVPAEQTIIDLLGQQDMPRIIAGLPFDAREVNLELYRRQIFLSTFISDQYHSTARGNKIYLAGWTSAAPYDDSIGIVAQQTVDTTLYLIELDAEINKPVGPALITADQFTWVTVQNDGFSDVSPANTIVYSNSSIAFRFTPEPDALLSQVNDLFIILQQSGGSVRSTNINIWNWRTQLWETVEITPGRQRIRDFEDYIGPQNAVQIQIERPEASGSYSLDRLAVEQRGTF